MAAMLRAATAIIASSLAIAAVPLMAFHAVGRAMRYPMPEDGAVSRNAYRSAYFGFAYPLLSDWIEDVKGPPPSASGYYSLAALKPRDALTATLLIAAQDNFFAQKHLTSAKDFLDQMRRQLVPSPPEEPPVQVTIAGRSFARLDYAGAGLQHVVFATEIRCHTLIFSITSRSPERIAIAVSSLNNMFFSGNDSAWPVCLPDYAASGHLIRRVEPAPAGPRFSSVPTRIIIGANGKVAHVHPIGALPEQAKSIKDALSRWEFKPYLSEGKPVAVETGLVVHFTTGP